MALDTRVEINTTGKSDGDVVTLLSGLGIPFMSREEAGQEVGGGRRKKKDDDAGDPWAKYRKRGVKRTTSSGGKPKKK
jgi:hypothetical protein